MSAKSVRRLSVAATAVVAAAVCGTLLAPAAHAASDEPLAVVLSDVSHNAVARGQGSQTLTLTVTNTTGTAQDYASSVFGIPDGPSPILGSQILLQAAPVTAPATDVTLGQEDASALVTLAPHGGKPFAPFSVPAHGSMSWKITFGFAKDYPSNDDGITLAFDTGHGSKSVHVDLPPAQADGKLTGALGAKATVAPGRPGRTSYDVADSAGGAFQSPLRTLVTVADAPKGMKLQVLTNGTWTDAPSLSPWEWTLPQIATGFKGGDKHHYDLRFTVPNGQGDGKARDLHLNMTTGMTEGNRAPIVDLDGVLRYDPTPVVTATAGPSPSASSSAAATPAPSASTTVAASTDAPATDAPSTDTGSGRQLAKTGSGNAGLLAGLAALFAAAGALVMASVARRRRNAA
ncbi:hypothetical protein [Actinacidiphila acidipaludis]|uniref:Gram-positive cocci surface proteins LPxTG domain-containing protein n=1 Tax=Actinacidiphila acidipaludis TaxID=2873382 RepID=A0ABS7Q6U8_9ACTN|nr:hypothetical protein [Streptomyces acidipaludis]MBY8878873.1 hypothetical protein [Streptomyces acidipaludis]